MTDEEKRASCHCNARCLIRQARADCDGSEHDVFEVLEFRLGEMLHEAGLSWGCFHDEAIDAMRDELKSS